MGSFWNQFAPATIEFCESLLDGYIRQPANAWSNVGFLVVGYLLWRRTPASKPWLRVFTIGSILVGITSTLFHVSMIFVAEFFDVASMFLTAGMLVVLNMMRLHWIKDTQIYKVLAIMQIIAMGLMYRFQEGLGEGIFAVQVSFIVLSEVFLIKRDGFAWSRYRWWAISVCIYVAATTVWVLDIRKLWCNPENHIFNGHAAWHLLNAAVVYSLYRFYEECIELKG